MYLFSNQFQQSVFIISTTNSPVQSRHSVNCCDVWKSAITTLIFRNKWTEWVKPAEEIRKGRVQGYPASPWICLGQSPRNPYVGGRRNAQVGSDKIRSLPEIYVNRLSVQGKLYRSCVKANCAQKSNYFVKNYFKKH